MANPNPLEAVAFVPGADPLWWYRKGSNCRTVVINNYKQCEDAVKILREHCAENPVLGFECEWEWRMRGMLSILTIHEVCPENMENVYAAERTTTVDLLQLCTHKGYCALIRLCAMDTLPPSLYDLLNDSHVVKVGIDALYNAGRLSREFNLTTVSTLDLRFVAVLTGKKPGTLNDMYNRLVRVTPMCLDPPYNWQANNLTQQQIYYAAGETIAYIEIYTTLAQKVSDVSVFKQYYDQKYD